MTTSADINFGDDDKAVFGAGSDLQIYHNGTDSFIDETNASGWLYIRGNNTVIGKYTGETYFKGITDGAVELYHDNSKKFETTSTGIDVTGNATFGDNGKAIFGAGSDLQIYHDASHSYIVDAGTGNFYLSTNGNGIVMQASLSETMFAALPDGAVTLYHDNAAKLATTSTGVDVTGTVTADGLAVDGNASITASLPTFTITGQGRVNGFEIAGTSGNTKLTEKSNNGIEFGTNNTNRMTINSSGTVMVGRTATGYSNTGAQFTASGAQNIFVADGDYALGLGRNNSDGIIQEFRKDGSTVGSIGVFSGKLTINSQGSNLSFATGGVVRMNNDSSQFYANSDNAMNLGTAFLRWNTLFASNSTINTSDSNEKQQIASLTSAEMTAAKAISALFKTYKWNDAVAAKGDAARRHAGVIAQEVQTAMTNAGLDAADYAFWCSDTWWETSTDVAAIEADEEAGIEARDAYTRIDTYNTADEAPEGATQRKRLGIRYPELLAFVGAATEQRLADLETRLTALENAE
jgi:hypothetical protein